MPRQVLVAALRHELQTRKGRDAGEVVAPDADAQQGAPPWDRLLLAPLEELQRRCAHRETQERILQATHQLLQGGGVGLRHGWLLVLSILWRAATKPTLLPLLPLAIRSVQARRPCAVRGPSIPAR